MRGALRFTQLMTKYFKLFFPNLYNIYIDLYRLTVVVADWHILVIDTSVEKVKSLLQPVFAPFEHLYKDNEPLQRYIWYVFFSIIISINLSCWPLFIYFFLIFEIAAIAFSSLVPNASFILRRVFVIFLACLFIMESFFDIDPLIFLEDAASAILFEEESHRFTTTYLVIQENLDELYFWVYYFAVFYAPQLSLTIILLAPLFGFVCAFLFGFLLGYKLIGLVASFFIFLSLLGASYILLFFPIFRQNFLNLVDAARDLPDSPFNILNLFDYVEFELFDFLEVNKTMSIQMDFGSFVDATFLNSSLEMSVDSVSAIFIFVITFISFLVHMYSIEYMRNDPHVVRFFGLLSFFTFSMLTLVSTSDMLVMFVGWEGVGLSSFLLISFWYTRVAALKSALKAILINKIGDMFLLFAIAIVSYYAQGDMSIYLAGDNIINHASNGGLTFYGLTLIDLAAMLVTLAAFVKSAQLFFHTWLPDAMEGPTPVSALLHAATMVTAGVYLVIRFSFLIEFSTITRVTMMLVAVWTLIITSLIALFQYDFKKIIAYSTCGQLAIMFIACSLSGYDFALFHFFNHAFFKCLLFLLAGMIIHDLRNEQDIRRMGNLSRTMPFTFIAFSIALLSSVGFPFFSGAVSKDLIIAVVDSKIIEDFFMLLNLKINYFLYILYFIKVRFALVVLTSLYMIRLYYYVFFCFPNHRKNIFTKKGYREPVVRSPIYMFVVSTLVVFSLISGKVFKNFFVFTECNYIDIHNDIYSKHCDSLYIAFNAGFSFLTHFTILAIFSIAAYAFYWMRKNGHISYFSLRYNYFFAYNELVTRDTYVLDCFDEYEEKEKEEFLAYFWRPISWPMNIYLFFNRRCYFDYIYNYYIVNATVELSSYMRFAFERGIFLFLADEVIAFSKKIGSYSGYHSPNGILASTFYAVAIFTFLWFAAPLGLIY